MSNFAISLNIPPWKLCGWFRRPQLWATVMRSFITIQPALMHHVLCRDFWWDIQSPRWLSPLQPRFGAPHLLAFPKTKIIFEREEISEHQWDQGKCVRAAYGNWENCVRSQGAYFEGDWGVIVQCPMFLVSCISFNKCLYFSYYTAGCLLDRPHIFWILILFTFRLTGIIS